MTTEKFYGADIGEFTPDQLRKLAELLEIPDLQHDPVTIVQLEKLGYWVDIPSGTIYSKTAVSSLPIGNISDMPSGTKTMPFVVIDPRRALPEENTLICFAVENRHGTTTYCLGMYGDRMDNMWSDHAGVDNAELYMTASVLWWWPLPVLPKRG